MMKRVLAFLLALLVLLPLTACVGSKDPADTGEETEAPPAAPAADTLAQLIPAMASYGIRAYLYGDDAERTYEEVRLLPAAFGAKDLDALLADRDNISIRSIWQVSENFYTNFGTEAAFLEYTFGITEVEVGDIFWIQLSNDKLAENGIMFMLVTAYLNGTWKIVQCGALSVAE